MREDALLAQARVLSNKHEALAAATGQNFNLFAILGMETDEVRTHSAILAELLDPNGTHGQGPVFATLFAKRFGFYDAGLERARVRCEEAIGKDSRVDIVLETDYARIVIENKIHAADQHRQLERYHAYADRWPMSKVFYLTLHGNEPTKDSLGELPLEKVTCISYETHVLEWLDECIREVARVPQLREILAHYQALLRKLTGKSKEPLTMDIKALLADKQGGKYNFELVPRIAEAMTALSVDTEWKFWKALRERLLEPGDRPWRLTHVDGIEDPSNPPKEVSEEIVRHAHGSGKNKWDYGWTLRIESEREPARYRGDDVEVLLRVECDYFCWGFYGLVAVEQVGDAKRQLARSRDTTDIFDAWAKRVSALGQDWTTNREWWLAWKYPNKNVDLRKTTWLAPKVIRTMVEDDCVAPLVREIRASVDRIEGWEPDAG